MLTNINISAADASNILSSVISSAVNKIPNKFQECVIQPENDLILIIAPPCIQLNFEATNLPEFAFFNSIDTEQNLSLIKLYLANTKGAVCQASTPYSIPNMQLIKLFKIQYTVLKQDIITSILVLANNIKNGEYDSLAGTAPHFLWANQDVINLDYSDLLEYLVLYAIPWYIKFYTSWQDKPKGNIENFNLDIIEPNIKLEFKDKVLELINLYFPQIHELELPMYTPDSF